MAETAALKLGNVISSSIAGSFAGLASGMRGALSEGIGFQTVSGALSKGFTRIEKSERTREKTRQEESDRQRGFTEEKDNEKRKFDQVFMSVVKGMAIDIELIQKDVRKILEHLTKETLWDKLKGLLAGLAGLPAKLLEMFGKFLKALKGKLKFPDFKNFKISDFFGNIFKNIGDFFKRLKLPDLADFTKRLKGFTAIKFPNVSKFFGKIKDFFEKIKFPETGKLLGEWFNRFRKALRLDDLANIFKLDALRKLLKFDNLKDAFKVDSGKSGLGRLKDGIGKLISSLGDGLDLLRLNLFVSFQNLKTSFSDGVKNIGKLITESDIVKSIGAMFDGMKTKFGDVSRGVDNLRLGIIGSLGGAVKVFSESNLGKSFALVAEDIGKIARALGAPFTALGQAIGQDLGQIRESFRTSVKVGGAVGDGAKAVGAADEVVKAADAARDLAKVGDALESVKDVAKIGEAADALKDTEKITEAVKSVGILGGIVGKIGSIGSGLGAMFTGPLKFLGQLTDVTPFLATVGKVLGPIGVIMSVFDGLSLAFNTEKLQKYFGKEDIGMQERISGFIGGFIGGFGGIIDMLAGAMGFEDTTFQEDMSRNISQGMNKVFDGIKAVFMFIGDILRSKPAEALFGALKETGSKIVEGLSSLFGFIKDVFMSDTMKTVVEKIGGFVTGTITNAIKILGSLVDLIVGVFTFDGEKIAKAGKDIWQTVTTGIKNSFMMIGNVIEQALQWVYNKIFGWWKSGSDKPVAATDATGMARNVEFETDSSSGATSTPVSPSRAPVSTGPATGNAPPVSAEAARMMDRQGGRGAPAPVRSTPSTPVLPSTPSVSSDLSGGFRSYTEEDLIKEGLRIKPGKTQLAGAEIHPSTVQAAHSIQNAFDIQRFTGFNDGYVRREHGGEDAHKKGLAFDFTLPPALAANDEYRNNIVESVRRAGFYIIDEYAYPSSRATAGHFHVELGRGAGKMVGTGKYSVGGVEGDPSRIGSGGTPSFGGPSGGPSPQTPPTTYERVNPETGETYYSYESGLPDTRAEENGYGGITYPVSSNVLTAVDSSGAVNQLRMILQEIRFQNDLMRRIFGIEDKNFRTENLQREEQTDALRTVASNSKDLYAQSVDDGYHYREQANNSRTQTTTQAEIANNTSAHTRIANQALQDQRKRDEYQLERDRLQEEFNNELKGVFRPLVQGILGPAGQASQQSERQGGRNIVGTFLEDDFKKLGVKIFGREQGAAIGETFQKLAGVYMDEFIDKALAPALGMESKYLNRSINTFLEGYKKTKPEIKRLEDNIKTTQIELDKYKKEKGDITTADIIRAGARKGFTADEKARLAEINRLNDIIKRNQEDLAKVKATRKEYKTAAMGDLIYGMTGIPTTSRNAIESIYGNKGAEGLVEDLASIFGAPFAGLFKASPMPGTQAGNTQGQGIVAQEVQARRQVNAEQVQGLRVVNSEQIQAQAQIQQGALEGQGSLFDRFLNGFGSVLDYGASMFRNVFSSAPAGYRPGAANGEWDMITDIAKDVVGGAAKDLVSGAVSQGVKTAFEETPFGLANMEPQGSGTYIPGGANGEWDVLPPAVAQKSGGFFDSITSFFSGSKKPGAKGDFASAAMGRVTNFATNYVENLVTSKLSNALGGGLSGNLLARAGVGALKGAVTGQGTILQNIGSSFGLKLGSGAGITDVLGGVFNQFNPTPGYAKAGMNVMQKLMPQGATNAFGQMGFDFFSGMGSSANFLGNLGSSLGLTKGMGFTGMSGSQIAGQALGALGTGMATYGLSKALSGGYDLKGVNMIAGLASLIPGVGLIAAPVGALFNRAFGRKPKKYTSNRVSGEMKFGGSSFQSEQDWIKKGGWFRSDKRGTDVTAFAQEDINAINESIGMIYDNMKIATEGLKLDLSKAYSFTKSVRFDATGLSAEQQQKKWEEIFTSFNNDLYKFTFGAPLEAARKVKKDAQGKEIVDEQGNKVLESYEETLLRLGQVDQIFNKSMKSILEISGKNIDTLFTRVTGQLDNATKILVADMKDAFVEAAGGLENLLRVEGEYIDLFYTAEEKRAQAIRESDRQVTEALANTGVSTSEFTKESFGTTTELQSQTLEDFMETQRLRYRTMIEDYERSYGWKLSSGDEKLVSEYSTTINKLKDAGSDFLTGAKLTWESANDQKKDQEASQPKATTTARKRGIGPGPAGELSFGANLSNVASSTELLGDNILSLGEAVQGSSSSVISSTNSLGGNILTLSGAVNASSNAIQTGLNTTANLLSQSFTTASGMFMTGLTSVATLMRDGSVTSSELISSGLEDAAGTMYTGSDLLSSGAVTSAELLSSGIATSANTIYSGSDLLRSGIVTSAEFVQAGLVTSANSVSSSFFTGSQLLRSGLTTSSELIESGLATSANTFYSGSNLITTGVTTSSELISAGLATSANTMYSSSDVLTSGLTSAANILVTGMQQSAQTVTDVMYTSVNTLVGVMENAGGGDSASSASSSSGTGSTGGVSEGAISIGLGMMGVSDTLGVIGGLTGLAVGAIGAAVVDAQMDAISNQMDAIAVANALGMVATVNADGSVSVSPSDATVAATVAAVSQAEADAVANAAAAASAAAASTGTAADGGSVAGDGSGVGDGTGGVYAAGGNFKAGSSMIVGEVGPEILIPNFAGTVIPTHKIIEAVRNASSLDTQTRNLLQNAAPVASPITSAYMLQQAMNTALNAERDILTSINNSMVNQTINNVSSPRTNIVSTGGGGGVRSDNPITGAFMRSTTRPRSF